MLLSNLVTINSGQAQFRITETTEPLAPVYTYYSQSDLDEDLFSISNPTENKQIRTNDTVNDLLFGGDIIFSLISGKATRVSEKHQGYLYTQNYVKLTPSCRIDSAYLVYLLNEDVGIQKQLQLGLQGSQVLKYTTKQLKELRLPKLPALQIQQMIGNVYFNQLKLNALKHRVANLEMALVLQQLKQVSIK